MGTSCQSGSWPALVTSCADKQVVISGVDGSLHVVADDAGAFCHFGGHRACVRIGQRDLAGREPPRPGDPECAGLRWRRPIEWTAAMSQFAILFGDYASCSHHAESAINDPAPRLHRKSDTPPLLANIYLQTMSS